MVTSVIINRRAVPRSAAPHSDEWLTIRGTFSPMQRGGQPGEEGGGDEVGLLVVSATVWKRERIWEEQDIEGGC